MNKRQKKRLLKIFGITWGVAGGIVLIWTILSFIQLKTATVSNLLSARINFSTWLYTLVLYGTITIILLIVREIIKRVEDIKSHEKPTGIKRILQRKNRKTSRR
jgi:hypothetical protein